MAIAVEGIYKKGIIKPLKDINIEEIGMAVIIQKMVNSEKYAKIDINKDELSINCVYGLGETFSITAPDSYIVNSNRLEVINKVVNRQDSMFIRDDNYGRTVRKNINPELVNREKLSYDEIRKVSNFAINIYNYYNKNVNVEIALENGKFFLIDARRHYFLLSADLIGAACAHAGFLRFF